MRIEQAELRSVVNADGAAILDAKHGKISTLNPTGAFIWQALREHRALEEITMALALETGEEHQVVEHDTQAFVDELKKRNLLPR